VVHKIFGVNFVCDFKPALIENLPNTRLAIALLISCREVTGWPVLGVAAEAGFAAAQTKSAKTKVIFTFVSLKLEPKLQVPQNRALGDPSRG